MPSTVATGPWTCRRRRPKSSKHHRVAPRSSSCFRNPCVVFLCSFLALASLRFRVRPKRAAQWLHKHSRLRGKKDEPSLVVVTQQQSSSVGSSGSSSTTNNMALDFRLQEEGHLASGAAFQRYQAVTRDGEKSKAATIQQWTHAMLSTADPSSFQAFLEILQTKNPYRAFFFETRPVKASNMASKTFEFVLVDAPDLYQFATLRPDVQAFGEHFHCTGSAACVFTSLQGDATLIAPKPPIQADLTTFSHLANFCRKAQPETVAETWKLAIQTYVDQVERQSQRNLWFSTSGLGIAWLHFRVDQRPKYYTFPQFRGEK